MPKLGIGIFEGKKAKNNMLILKTLFDCGPLSLWSIAKQMHKQARPGKISKDLQYGSTQRIQSVVSKRLRDLEKKQYVRKEDHKWILRHKGIIAVLIIEPKPKPLGSAWSDFIPQYVLPDLEKMPSTMKYESKDLKIQASATEIKAHWRKVYEDLKDLEKWVALAQASKNLMAQGVINLDLVSNLTLMKILIAQEDFWLTGDYQQIIESLKAGEKTE